MSTRHNVTERDVTREAVIRQGRQIYEEKLRAELEPDHTGRFVAVELNTGEYFLGDTDAEALYTAHAELPKSRFYLKLIGYDYTHRIGSYAGDHYREGHGAA